MYMYKKIVFMSLSACFISDTSYCSGSNEKDKPVHQQRRVDFSFPRDRTLWGILTVSSLTAFSLITLSTMTPEIIEVSRNSQTQSLLDKNNNMKSDQQFQNRPLKCSKKKA